MGSSSTSGRKPHSTPIQQIARGSRTSSRRGKKFVTLDARCDSGSSFILVHAQDASVTANMNVTGESDLLWQGEYEFDGTAGLDNRFHYEVEAAEADVARFSFFFEDAAIR